MVCPVRDGFRENFVGTILGSEPHIEILPHSNTKLKNHQKFENLIRDETNVISIWSSINEEVMITSSESSTGTLLVGISNDDIRSIPLIKEPKEYTGTLELSGNGIAIGFGMASKLDVKIGDFISIVSPNGIITPFGRSPLIEEFEVRYIYQVGRYDLDNAKAFINFKYAQEIFGKLDVADKINIFVEKPENIELAQSHIVELIKNSNINGVFKVITWKDKSKAFLEALDLEDSVMFIIMSLLVLIASLNIVSGLIMLVKNKTKDIGILRTMGYSKGSIMQIFFLSGSLIGIFGTITGVLFGLVFSYNVDYVIELVSWLNGQDTTDGRLSLIDEISNEVRIKNITLASFVSLSLSFIVTLLPARNASNIEPVKALKNE
jgi:lipoprotein-releasing system permease protein